MITHDEGNQNFFKPESKYNMFELFAVRPSHDKKIDGTVHFPICETLLIDNGQIYKWLFNATSGEVMKKHSSKLNKEFLMTHFLRKLIEVVKIKEGYKLKRSESEILSDINRLSLILERYERSDQFPDEYKYLEKLNNFRFIYPRSAEMTILHPQNSSYFTSITNKDVLSIFEFNKLLSDSNKLSMLRMIHSFIEVNLNYHPLICRFYRKSEISQRKIQIYTPLPNAKLNQTLKKVSLMTVGSNLQDIMQSKRSHDDSQDLKSRKYASQNSHLLGDLDNMTLMHNATLSEIISSISNKFINLLESYFESTMVDGLFRFLRVDDYSYLFYSCERILFKKNFSLPLYNTLNNTSISPEEAQKMRNTVRSGYMHITRSTNKYGSKGYLKNSRSGSPIHKSETMTKFPLFGNEKVYEKLGSIACNGEFCDFDIPKHFKNIKLFQKEKTNISKQISKVIGSTHNKRVSSLGTAKRNAQKISGIESYSQSSSINLINKLSLFSIKKIYDNPILVNMLLKSYKIFPPNVDEILQNIKEDYISEELKRKAKAVPKNKHSRAQEPDNPTDKEILTSPVILTGSGTNTVSTFNEENTIQQECITPSNHYSRLKKARMRLNNKFDSQSPPREEYLTRQLRLYEPTPNKFRHINSDKLYSEVRVCDNCYVIYLLLDGFLNNINEKDSSFKDVLKAKHTLTNSEKNNAHEDIENPNILYLYKEEKNQFDLKKILKRQIKKENKANSSTKIRNRIEQNKKTQDIYNYKMEINPKILNFNLAAENKHNKFFKVIFDQIHSNQDELSNHLGINTYNSVFSKSMTALRMHMGINSTSGHPILNSNNTVYPVISQGSYFISKKYRSEEKSQPNTNLEKDLFMLYKMIKKQKNPTSLPGKSIIGMMLKQNEDKKFKKNENLVENADSFSKAKEDKMHSPKKHGGIVSKIDDLKSSKEVEESFDNEGNRKNNIAKDFSIIESKNSSEMNLSKDLAENIIRVTKGELPKDEVDFTNSSVDEGRDDRNNLKIRIENNSEEGDIKFTEEEKNDNDIPEGNKHENISHFSEEMNKSEYKKSDSNTSDTLKFNVRLQEKIKEIQARACSSIKGKPYKHCLNFRNLMDENERFAFDQKLANAEIKKVSTQSIFYYEWSKETSRFSIPNYYTTTPLTCFNEINTPIYDNPLIYTREMKIEDFFKLGFSGANNPNTGTGTLNSPQTTIFNFNDMAAVTNKKSTGKFLNTKMSNYAVQSHNSSQHQSHHRGLSFVNETIPQALSNCEVFVYDQFTAVPYKITTLFSKPATVHSVIEDIGHAKTSRTGHKSENKATNKLTASISQNNLAKSKPSDLKLLVITINDFFESFHKTESYLHEAAIKSINTYFTNLRQKNSLSIDEDLDFNTLNSHSKVGVVKHLMFNLPGQPYTIFRKGDNSTVMNNIYYSDFLDRFLYYLHESDKYDKSYKIIFVGIGNGGHIALTYTSLYEKYWDIIQAIICFNVYLENDDFLNKSMFEILKIIEATGDSKLVDFFIRSITENPNKLLKTDNANQNTPNGNFSLDVCSIPGYLMITKGYFYNLKINLSEISTPIFCVHSNQNCFITINNLNKFFSYLQAQTFFTQTKDTDAKIITMNKEVCTFKELFFGSNRRKLVIIDGCHDMFSEEDQSFQYIIEYLFDYLYANVSELSS